MFKKILCPVDFSEAALNAANSAIELAEQFHAKITFIHVIDINTLQNIGDLSFGAIDDLELLEEEEKPILNKLKQECEKRNIDVKTILTHGVPVNVITDMLKKGDFDLIVMGTHGRKGLNRAVFGSVAEIIVRHSKTPVLLYHSSDDK